MNLKFFYSPLEQFEVLPLIPLYFGGIDVSITNETVILLIIFFFISILFFSSFNPKDSTLNLIPSKFQSVFEFLYRVIISLVVDNLGKESGQPFFPILFSIFFFYRLSKFNRTNTIQFYFNKSSNCYFCTCVIYFYCFKYYLRKKTRICILLIILTIWYVIWTCTSISSN